MDEQQVNALVDLISDALKVALGDKLGEAKDFAKSESRKFAQKIVDIA